MPIRIAIDAFRANPLRTVLATLGVIIGVASLVAVLALGDGFEASMRRMVSEDGRLQTVVASSRVVDNIAGERVARAQVARLMEADLVGLRKSLGDEVHGPVDADLRVMGVAWTGPEDWATRSKIRAVPVFGSTAPSDTGSPVPLSHGRFFAQHDADASSPVIVVSDSLARHIAGGEPSAALGRPIQLGGRQFTVIGVADSSAPQARQRGVFAAMPLSLALESMAPSPTGHMPLLQLKAERMEDVIPAKESLERWLASRFGAGWADSVIVQSYEKEAGKGAQGILMFKLFMGFITGISLVVGGIGIMNVLLASVTERTREIGIRRAVGAKQRDILVQFLAESVLVSMVGGAIGTVLGVSAAYVATMIMEQRAMAEVSPGFSGSTLLVVVIAASTVGILFGTYPAMRASRLSPIDALRHE